MTVFAWQGVSGEGKIIKGVRDADSPKALRQLLRRDGVLVTKVQEKTSHEIAGDSGISIKRWLNRVSTADLALATRQLATLLKSGIPLVDALNALIEQLEKPDLQSAFNQTRAKVNEGISLAEALGEHPKQFSDLYVSMVAAGESSGTLETVLARLAEFLEAQARLKSKVLSAMAYPIFMALMGTAVVGLMMVVVVPKVTSIFQDFNQVLPWYTRVLILVSNVISGYWWALLLVGASGVYAFRRWKATPEGRDKWDLFILRVPQLGSLVVMIAVTRFSRTLATMLSSGVPMLSAMETSRRVLGNTALMKVIEDARNSVREGESIADPIKRSGRFPPIVTHMIAIGERSGQLEEMLENVAAAYDSQVESKLATMTALLEPIMIVVMGGIAGSIAFSILMPLMKLNEFIG
ncbi:MAG: type II secretion system inner membrane protein GspF [Myxococcales bacterium]|nr:type II secretion system inner membrane protein GspF [Myxococcales bacterium]MCB9709272.1 type II secretion system inner membrane protein GspF [Myxococcales bacterium]